MSALPKYTFELEFDENGEIVNQVEEEEELEEPEDLPPPEPTFSKAEVEAAREEGHKAGREEMRTEAEAATETSAMLALNALAEHFAELSAAQEAAIEEIRRESVAIACAVTRKMFPNLAKDMALPEIESVIHTCLREYITEPRIFVRVHEDVREMVKEKTDPIVEQTGFQGDLIVVAEPGLGRSDCVLEWGAGGAERRTEWLWQNIDREVADSLGVAVEELEAFPWGPRAKAPVDEDAETDVPTVPVEEAPLSEPAAEPMPAADTDMPAEAVAMPSEAAPAEVEDAPAEMPEAPGVPEVPEVPEAPMSEDPGMAMIDSIGDDGLPGDGLASDDPAGGDLADAELDADPEAGALDATEIGGEAAITQEFDDGELADDGMIGDASEDDLGSDGPDMEILPPEDPDNPQA